MKKNPKIFFVKIIFPFSAISILFAVVSFIIFMISIEGKGDGAILGFLMFLLLYLPVYTILAGLMGLCLYYLLRKFFYRKITGILITIISNIIFIFGMYIFANKKTINDLFTVELFYPAIISYFIVSILIIIMGFFKEFIMKIFFNN